MHHEIHIAVLKKAALSRPEGYLDDVLSHGKQIGDNVYISDYNYQELCQKYSPQRAKALVELSSGPGSLLATLILQLTGKVSKNCMTCSTRVKQMNQWGWAGCLLHIGKISGWLVEEAEKLGHKVDGNIVLGLLKAAISEAMKPR
jgi:hypothetical protein